MPSDDITKTLEGMLDHYKADLRLDEDGRPEMRMKPAFIDDVPVPSDRVIVVNHRTDFSQIELRVLAAMALHGDAFVLYGQTDAQIAHRIDYHFMHNAPDVLCREPEGEPIKQNGRSAAYLKHDRSKRHGRR